MNDRSDDDLVLAVAQGDEEAFAELVTRHHARAWKTAYNLTKSGEEAKDLVQEAFLRVLNHASSYKAHGAFSAYLRTILGRLWLDWRSRRSVEMRHLEFLEVGECRTPSAEVLAGFRAHAVRRALDKLPTRQAVAIELRHFEGFGLAEIADIMEVSLKSVEGLLDRGRSSLRQHLAAYGAGGVRT